MIHLKSLIALSMAIACQAALAQVIYRIHPVPTLNGCPPFVSDFNNAGQATGQVCAREPGHDHAFLWKHDSTPLLDLGPDQPGFNSDALAMNDSGAVTGTAAGDTGEFFAYVSTGDGSP